MSEQECRTLRVDNLVVGATFYGVGLALALSGRTLLVEQRSALGYDFADSMNAAAVTTAAESAAGRQLMSIVERNGLIAPDGRVSVLPNAGALAVLCAERCVSILFETAVLQAEGGDALLYNCDGKTAVHAEHIYDARPCGERLYGCTIDGSPPKVDGRFVLQRGAAADEYYLHARLVGQQDYTDARALLHEAVQRSGGRIVCFANDYSYEGWYDNFLSAFEAGAAAKNLRRFERNFTPCELQCDVCVAGLGTAGAMAAIAAARQGAEVIGIDALCYMGGTASGGCVYDYYYGGSGGEYEKINRSCIADAAFAPSDERQIVGAAKLYHLEQAADFTRLYGMRIVGAECENGRLCALLALGDNGLLRIRAAMFVDCSGGELAVLAGARVTVGRRSDGKTMRFSVARAFMKDGALRSEWSVCDYLLGSAAERSEKLLSALAAPPCIDRARGYSDERMVGIGAPIGVRESRNVLSLRQLQLFECEADRPLFYAFAPVDCTNKDMQREDDDIVDWHCIMGLGAYGIGVGVPIEAMTPRDVRGLLVAGRAMGLSHAMACCIRMKSDMERSGEVAGTAAAMAAAAGCEPCELEYQRLFALLERCGCVGEPIAIAELADEITPMALPRGEQIIAALRSDTPQLALYALRIGELQLHERLYELSSQRDRLGECCAIALGMLGCRQAIDRLREIAQAPAVTYGITREKYRYDWYKSTLHCNRDKAKILLERLEKQC